MRRVPELEPLMPGYLENRKKDFEKMTLGIQANDFGSIEAISHKIKGSAGGYGFDELTDIGGRIETAAMKHEEAEIRKLLEQMREYIAQASEILSAPEESKGSSK